MPGLRRAAAGLWRRHAPGASRPAAPGADRGALPQLTREQVERFRADLEALTYGEAPGLLGVAVSGGPDSLALLLLAHAAYPGRVRAATVDHGLRPEAAAEAKFVAGLCARLGVPHATIEVPDEFRIAGGNTQAQARSVRYLLLGQRLGNWVATAHHVDDQAETLLMRLNRGSGVGGLAGVRPKLRIGMDEWAVRPLLGWRKAELVEIVRDSGIEPVDDPSNRSPDFDRTAMRELLARSPELDPSRLAASASHLADAEAALLFAELQEWETRARRDGGAIELNIAGLPRELLRRLASRAVEEVRGTGGEWRRDKLMPLLDRLGRGGRATVAEVQIAAARGTLRFEPAPPRRG